MGDTASVPSRELRFVPSFEIALRSAPHVPGVSRAILYDVAVRLNVKE